MKMIIRRFDERAYMYNITKQNANYITENEINSILDEYQYCDITFKFVPTASGYRTLVVDNLTEEVIALDDLNSIAMDYYLSQVAELSKSKAQKHIEQIRELLYA